MKELLIIAFNEAYDKLCSSVPKTKEIQKVLNIENLFFNSIYSFHNFA